MRRHPQPIKLLPYAFVAVVALVLGISAHIYYRNAHAANYFRDALSAAHISETVTVGSRTYTIDKTTISTAPRKALSVAYAVAVAERSPILALAGTDLDSLTHSIQALAHAQQSLVAAQKSSADAAAVQNLYPTQFLTALAQVERVRQRFLQSHTDTDEAMYEDAQRIALQTAATDLDKSLTAYTSVTSPLNLIGIGGVITSIAQHDALVEFQRRMSELGQRLNERASCLAGHTAACNTTELSIPSLSISEPFTIPPTVSNILSLIDEARARSPVGEARIVGLAHSNCTAASPAFFWESGYHSTAPLFYLDELYFTKTTQPNAPTLQYLKSRGISYSLYNPMTFYVCPDVVDDFGVVHAIIATAEFAKTHPALAPALRSELLSGDVLYQSRAERYITAALQSASRAEESSLIDLALQFNQKTARFDKLIAQIARTDEEDAWFSQNGVPITLTPKQLFLTHMASLSLFVTLGSVSIRTPLSATQKETEKKTLPTYSSLSSDVSRSTFIENLRAFFQWEAKAWQ
jgi:hypothetical protein